MDKNSIYQEQARIAKAWIDFVSQGVIPQNIRPMIAESWLRCKENGLNAWDSPYLDMKRTTGELNKRLQKKKWMIDACISIMQYLSRMVDEVCFKLKDTDGYVLYTADSVDSSKLYLHGEGLILNESKQGTIASALALRHQTHVDINGFEHFFVCYHKFFRSAFPVRSPDGEIGGMLELFCNYYSDHTVRARECMKIASCLIENCIRNEDYDCEKAPKFGELLDLAADPLCCIDYAGKIVNINKKLLATWGLKDHREALGCPLTDFLSLKNHDLLRMYPKNVQIAEGIDLNGQAQQAGISAIYRPRQPESYLIRFHHAEENVQNRPWAAVERIIVLGDHVTYDDYGMIGHSPGIVSIRKTIKKIAPTPATVLIEGPTGTGKELIARAIHEHSGAAGRLVVVNCGAIPEELLQSELFGYVPGAFTGADKKGRQGKLEAADHGTIFLDEIGEMPLNMQVTLLRFLQDFTVTRLGANTGVKVNTRVIAATNRSLEQEVRLGNFRQDLYYRLNVVKIYVPALIHRKEDIIPIAQYYLDEYSRKYKRTLNSFDQESAYLLCTYQWPGNIRELKNAVERIALFAESDAAYVTKELLPEEIERQIAAEDEGAHDSCGAAIFQKGRLEELEKRLILDSLEQCGGNYAKTAEILGIHRTTLYRKLKKMGIQ